MPARLAAWSRPVWAKRQSDGARKPPEWRPRGWRQVPRGGGVIANQLARYDGSTWSAFGSGLDQNVYDIVVAPNGDVIVAGKFDNAGDAPASHVARWTGVGIGANAAIEDVGLSRDGDLFVSGPFTRLAGMPSAAFGRAITSCPALVQSSGSGCIGPNGPLVLAPLSSPWSGSEYRT